MRKHLILLGLSSMVVGYLVGLLGDHIWITFPAMVQGYASFRLWKDLKK